MNIAPDGPATAWNSWSIDDDEASLLRAFVQLNRIRSVLEFGPGKSTQAFLDAGCDVWSLEHDPLWFERIRQQLGQQSGLKQLLLYPFQPELHIPELQASRFDLAFVDGPPTSCFRRFARLNAIEFAGARTDIVLLHDSRREMEQNSMAVMEEKGWSWRQLLSRRGLAAGVRGGTCVSIRLISSLQCEDCARRFAGARSPLLSCPSGTHARAIGGQMIIGFVGAGNVGEALGKRWAVLGHQIRFGVRNPKDAKYAALAGPQTAVVSIQDAVANAEIVVLATPWQATQEAIQSAGDLSGKVILDATNPWVYPQGLVLGFNTSGGEEVAKWARGAKVVKAMNQIGAKAMADSTYPGNLKPVMLIAGDDATAKQKVSELIADLGFEAVDFGPLAGARLLEPYAAVWIDLALKHNQGSDFAFAILRKR